MSRYDDFVECKTREFNSPKWQDCQRFNASELAPKFIDAFNKGDTFRVLVDFGYSEDEKPIWGYVGVTTGWKPVFLLMRRRGQHGSSEILRENHKILKTKWVK